MAEFAYNSRPHSSIGRSPFTADLGYEPRAYDDLALLRPPRAPRNALTFIEHQDQVLQRCLDALESAHDRMKHFYDRNRPDIAFAVGDQVLLDTLHLDLAHVGAQGHRKFASRFIGPYKILATTTPNTYRISLPPGIRLHDEFHIQYLRPYHEDANPNRLNRVPRLITHDGTEGNQIRATVGQRERKGIQYYKVQWYGRDEPDTWEPATNLTQAKGLIDDFLSSSEATTRSRIAPAPSQAPQPALSDPSTPVQALPTRRSSRETQANAVSDSVLRRSTWKRVSKEGLRFDPDRAWSDTRAAAIHEASCHKVLALLAHRRSLDARAPPLHAALITEIRDLFCRGSPAPEPTQPPLSEDVHLLFFDGRSRGNPEPGGSGACIVRVPSHGDLATILWSAAMSRAHPSTTNNQAEYYGLLVGLRAAATYRWPSLEVVGDSALILRQLRDHRPPKNPRLLRLYYQARRLADQLDVQQTHQVRAHNQMADSLANLAMDTRISSQVLHPSARYGHGSLHSLLSNDLRPWLVDAVDRRAGLSPPSFLS